MHTHNFEYEIKIAAFRSYLECGVFIFDNSNYAYLMI